MKELHLTTNSGLRFKVVKEKDDPMTNRLSIGGSKNEGCYIVYRGETKDCLEVLEQALEAMKTAHNANQTQCN